MQSLPQFFGQSFSSSSFVDSSGQVVSSSIYTDTSGNRIVDGQNYPTQQVVPVQKVVPQVIPAAAQPQSTVPKKVSSGQYIPDDRGKYKGN